MDWILLRSLVLLEHLAVLIKIQNLLDLAYFKAACSKYQSVNETNTKIQFHKSVFRKQEIFSRLGQIWASLMVLDFPATGDNYDEMLVVMRMVMIQASSSVALSPFSSSSHPFHSQFHCHQYIVFLFSGACAICILSQGNMFYFHRQILLILW